MNGELPIGPDALVKDSISVQDCSTGASQNELASPVWVHSSWRVSSTWLWGVFRRNPRALAYQEVFHESLALLTQEKLLNLHPRAWDSRHPPSAPYFLEYAPLLAQGPLACDEQMAYGMFLPTSADRSITEAEADHVGRLIDLARTLERTPVLTAVRSLGRVHGLKRRFRGFHILLHRNLFRQWCSYASQELQGNSYFVDRTDIVIERNGHDPYLATIARLFPSSTGGMKCTRWEDFVRFVLLHLYLLVRAWPDCDLEVCVDRLANNAQYRNNIVERITEKTGLAVDLSSCREAIEFSAFAATEQTQGILETVRIMAGEIPAFLPRWSEQQRNFLEAQLEAFETEMDRSLFYTRALTQFSTAGFPTLAEARKAATGYPGIVEEWEALKSQIHKLAASLCQSGQEIDELRHRLQEAIEHAAAKAQPAEPDSVTDETTGPDIRDPQVDALEAKLAESQAQSSSLEAQLESMQAEACRIEVQNERLRAEIVAVRRSTSWRITRPIRALKSFW